MTTGIKHLLHRYSVALATFVLLMVPIGCFAAADLAIVNVKNKALVYKDKILLGKLANIETSDQVLRNQLENCVVGRSPLPGRSRQIEGNYIKLKLKQSGIDISRIVFQAPDHIEVTRQSLTISSEELKTIARSFIEANTPYAQDRIRIKKIQANQEVVLPSGKITYQVKPPQHTDYVGNIPLAITFKCNGASVKKVWVMVTVEVMSDIIVVKKPLGRYQVIKMADIELQARDLAKVPNNALTSLEDVVGQRAKRTIDTQTVLTANMIESPPLVRRGDIVVMIAESGGLRISTQGEARQRGGQR